MTDCVQVPRETGEATRRRLEALGLLDHDREITHEDDRLYIPVTTPDDVPDDLTVVAFDAPSRDTQSMPADILGFDPSYERIGDIVVLHETDDDRATDIADAVMASALPVKTVLNRASPIKGEERVRDWERLAGNGTDTTHREYGYEYHLDLADVYFSPRLATERHRVTQQIQPGEHVLDMFAGVGPYAIPAAGRGATVVAVDINDRAIALLEENADRNDVADTITTIHGDVRDIVADYRGWADRLIMNLPHSAHDHLDTAIALAGDDCHLHYYDIQPDDDPYTPGIDAITDAAAEYTVSIDVRRTVRSYAPHEVNVCLDAHLTRG